MGPSYYRINSYSHDDLTRPAESTGEIRLLGDSDCVHQPLSILSPSPLGFKSLTGGEMNSAELLQIRWEEQVESYSLSKLSSLCELEITPILLCSGWNGSPYLRGDDQCIRRRLYYPASIRLN